MQILLRSWLVWLLALAIPVQGIAAVRLQHCAPTHDRMHVAAVAAPGHAHAAGHAQGADVGGGERTSDLAAASMPGTGHDTTHPEGSGAAKCSACAACCLALALPTRAVEFLPERASAPVIELPWSRVDSFVPGGLDRPPRPARA